MSITEEIMKEYNLKCAEETPGKEYNENCMLDEYDKHTSAKDEIIEKLEKIIEDLNSGDVESKNIKFNISYQTKTGVKYAIKYKGYCRRGLFK